MILDTRDITAKILWVGIPRVPTGWGGGGSIDDIKEIPFPLLPDFIEAEAIHSLTGMCEH